MPKLRFAVESRDPVNPNLSQRLKFGLAERYGDDALLAHGWIEDRLWTNGVVELEDDAGRTWQFNLTDLLRFVVR